jgi:hypothetical protein
MEPLEGARYDGHEYTLSSLPIFLPIETQMCTGKIKQQSGQPSSSASLWFSLGYSFPP